MKVRTAYEAYLRGECTLKQVCEFGERWYAEYLERCEATLH